MGETWVASANEIGFHSRRNPQPGIWGRSRRRSTGLGSREGGLMGRHPSHRVAGASQPAPNPYPPAALAQPEASASCSPVPRPNLPPRELGGRVAGGGGGSRRSRSAPGGRRAPPRAQISGLGPTRARGRGRKLRNNTQQKPPKPKTAGSSGPRQGGASVASDICHPSTIWKTHSPQVTKSPVTGTASEARIGHGEVYFCPLLLHSH